MTLNILITGSEGYIGQACIARLQSQHQVVGVDIRPENAQSYPYYREDIRSARLADIMQQHQITHVIHLASVMQASDNRERDYDIDVNGTQNVVESCVQANVQHLTVTSSGAAYGYHANNPMWLSESDPLRGNKSFAYSYHKRLIEEMLADYRLEQPQLKQLVLRPGTVLGAQTKNQITDLFAKRRLLAIKGSESPFVFIWDQDVVNIIHDGVTASKEGQYNLAGDGAMTISDIAEALNKPLLTLPPWLLKSALRLGHKVGLTQYSAEQIDFLRYRPVLANQLLKASFGYTPQKTSREVFAFFLEHNPEYRS